jgi:hypothetical protein
MKHTLLFLFFGLGLVTSAAHWPYIINDGCPEKNPDYDETDPDRNTCPVYICCDDDENCPSGKTPTNSPTFGLGCIGGDCQNETDTPSASPTFITTVVETIINRLTSLPTSQSLEPSVSPTAQPSVSPTAQPSVSPTAQPSSDSPSNSPSDSPSDSPSQYPTWISTSKVRCPFYKSEP